MIAARNPGDDPFHHRSLCCPKTVATHLRRAADVLDFTKVRQVQ